MTQKSKKRLILVDGSMMVYRSYFAFIKNPLVNSKGENTGAVFGIANSLLKILSKEKFTHIAVCFDTAVQTFRHKMYKEYKATREKMPDELADQLPVVKELIEALGIPVVEKEGFEADDVMGTLAKRALSKQFFVSLISFDKDFMQLLTEDEINIIKPSRGKISEEIITAEGVKEKVGVTPQQIVDYLTLVGDTSDNVPGVPGVGPVTAVKLLQNFGTVENIISQKERIPSKKIRSAIDEEKIKLSKKLVTIDTDMNLPITIDSLFYKGKDKLRLKDLFEKCEFTSLVAQFDSEPKVRPVFKEIKQEEIESITKAIKGKVSMEYLSFDDSLQLSLTSGGTTWVTGVFEKTAFHPQDIRSLLAEKKTVKISSDVKSLMHLLDAEEIDTEKGFFDVSLASYLLDPSRGNHAIDSVSIRFGNISLLGKDELVKGYMKGKVEEEELKQELSRCSQTGMMLYPVLKKKLVQECLEKLFDTLEMPLVSVLARIERTGILLDIPFFVHLSKEYDKRIDEIEKNIFSIAGEEFNVRSPKQLQKILYEKLKLNPPRKTKTGFSTDSDALLILTADHDLPKEILKYRELFKLKSTYIDALPRLADKQSRVHTTLIQTTAATGRLTSRNPNLQNIPARGDMGRTIRKGFIAPKGKRLLSCDYSQIELRILAHLSQDENLKEAFFNDVDIHRRTASSIFQIPEDGITREMRRRAKIVNFGIIYGMSPYGLAKELMITPEEGMSVINMYFDTYPKVKEWIDNITKKAEDKGYTETLMGRKRRIVELQSKNFNTREFGKRIAVNTPVQGSAADIIKRAMINIDKRLRKGLIDATMILQVHDELLFEVNSTCIDEAKELIVYEMENAVQLSVGLKVDAGIGNNWFEAH